MDLYLFIMHCISYLGIGRVTKFFTTFNKSLLFSWEKTQRFHDDCGSFISLKITYSLICLPWSIAIGNLSFWYVASLSGVTGIFKWILIWENKMFTVSFSTLDVLQFNCHLQFRIINFRPSIFPCFTSYLFLLSIPLRGLSVQGGGLVRHEECLCFWHVTTVFFLLSDISLFLSPPLRPLSCMHGVCIFTWSHKGFIFISSQCHCHSWLHNYGYKYQILFNMDMRMHRISKNLDME